MKQITDLVDLLIDQIKTIDSDEHQLLGELPKFIELVNNDEFKTILEWRHEQTKRNIFRLGKVLEYFGESRTTSKSVFIGELFKQTKQTLLRISERGIMEAKLLLLFQCVGHYQIANYSAMLAFTKAIGIKDEIKYFERSLKEEKNIDRKLTNLASQKIYKEANIAAFF